jgi:predicted ATPase
MITELRVHNFRTFINATFRFKQRHLLIGKNNSGKTNLCWAMAFLRASAERDLAAAISVVPGANWDFCNYAIGDKDRVATFGLSCKLGPPGTELRYRYELAVQVADPRRSAGQLPTSSIVSENLFVTGDGFSDTNLLSSDGTTVKLLHEGRFRRGQTDHYVETRAPADSTMLAKLYELETNPAAVGFRKFLQVVQYFNISAERIRAGWRDTRNLLGMEAFGANLAQMLYLLKTAQEGRYRRVLERVRCVEPQLIAINYQTGPEQNVVPAVELAGRRQASWASLSDGTLRALALSYLFELANFEIRDLGLPSAVFVFEEPENSLFVGELQSLLYQVENVVSDAQTIFTTHSPYFIEQFDNDLDAVTLLQRKEWYTTSVSLGERRAEIEEALKSMSLGEQYFRDMLG